MNFGEIVEPSTRALIEDDYENCPEFLSLEVNWSNKFTCPEDLNTLIFIETRNIIDLFKTTVIDYSHPLNQLPNAGIKIYRKVIENNNSKYIILYEAKEKCSQGQLVEELSDWIKQACQIVTITSAALPIYQNQNERDKSATYLRMLSTSGRDSKYSPLEVPNSITGLGASVFSFCKHIGKNCTSFITYLDSSPLDSINTRPVLNLLRELQLDPDVSKLKVNTLSNNLYM